MPKSELLRFGQEAAGERPKSPKEHRIEFTRTWSDCLISEGTWEEEEGGKIEGRVYEVGVWTEGNLDWEKKVNSKRLGDFWLKAHQSGFKVVDRIKIESANYHPPHYVEQAGILKLVPGNGAIIHQFHLKGKPH